MARGVGQRSQRLRHDSPHEGRQHQGVGRRTASLQRLRLRGPV